MDVKPGYKQTEVGVLPDEWDAGGLSRFWSVTDCKHVTAEFIPEGFPLASIKEVQSRFVDLTNAKRTTNHFYSLLIEGGRKPRPGDLILSRNATVGEVAQVAEWHPAFAMGQDVCLLRKKSTAHSTEFLQAVFQSPVILNQLNDLMVGSTFKRVNVRQIRNFSVPMPLPSEQQVIAEALSDLDALLGSLDRLIAKKRDLKQAAMQQLLTGQTRLPSFHGKWKSKRFAELLRFERPDRFLVNSADYLETGDIPVLTANKSFILGYTNDEFGIYQDLPAIIFDDFTTDSKYVDFPFKVKSSAIKILKARSAEVNLQFTFARMRLVNFPLGEHKRYYISEYQHIELPTPEPDEQTAIAEVMTDMDAELAVLEQRQEKTHNLKQAMMQELLTGRIRLVSAASNLVSLPQKQKGAIAKPAHNWQINEAVIIGVLAGQFGTEEWPLPRKRQVKLTYLLHRHVEGKADGYLKKAAGPYNPKTKYQGPEGIALKNRYVRKHNNGTYVGFVAAEKIAQAEQYFAGWYPGAKEWLEQFRFEKTDELELLATIDMAVEDLRSGSRAVELNAVKKVIRIYPEWQTKLSRPIFSDDNITRAINKCSDLFAS